MSDKVIPISALSLMGFGLIILLIVTLPLFIGFPILAIAVTVLYLGGLAVLGMIIREIVKEK